MRNSFPSHCNSIPVAVFLAALLCLPSAQSENLVPSGAFENPDDIEAWSQAYNVRPVTNEVGEGLMNMLVMARGWLMSPEQVEIDPGGIYKLRARFKIPEFSRHPNEATETHYQIGLAMYDESGERLGAHAVFPVAGSEQELIAAVDEGATVVKVTGEWVRRPHDGIAFDACPDFSDIPNPASYPIREAVFIDGHTELTLARPLDVGYPEGTMVRQKNHADITAATDRIEGTDWIEVELEFFGHSEPGQMTSGKFWPGTTSVRAAMNFFSDDPDDRVEVIVDEVSLTRQ